MNELIRITQSVSNRIRIQTQAHLTHIFKNWVMPKDNYFFLMVVEGDVNALPAVAL